MTRHPVDSLARQGLWPEQIEVFCTPKVQVVLRYRRPLLALG